MLQPKSKGRTTMHGTNAIISAITGVEPKGTTLQLPGYASEKILKRNLIAQSQNDLSK